MSSYCEIVPLRFDCGSDVLLTRDAYTDATCACSCPAGIVLIGDVELPLELGQPGALVIDTSPNPADRHHKVCGCGKLCAISGNVPDLVCDRCLHGLDLTVVDVI